jgi:surface antigen
MTTANQAISKAKSFVRKEPYGSTNKFNKWYGLYPCAWCAIFVYYVLSACGGKRLEEGCSNKAYCPSIWAWAKAKGYARTSGPKKGDLVLYDWQKDGVCDHIGFVICDNGNGTITTVEGNTSNTSNGNGGCVQVRVRAKSLVKGYVRLPYKEVPYPTTYLYKGVSSKSEVKKLQKCLNKILKTKLSVDGIYGSKTKKAVKRLQAKAHIKTDGIVGSNTRAAIKKYL